MSAIQQLLTEHLDLWTATDTAKKSGRGRGAGAATSVYGIKKLRELILELAVRGKLVPQDANDEPASELLKRIQAEKARLIAEGKINKDKPPAAISEDEKPFELPEGWEWVQFGEICGIERGGSPRPIKSFLTDAPEGLNWIKIGDTEQGGKYITSSSEKITRDGLSKTRMVYPGDFLLTNSMSFGRPYITKIEGCIHDGWLRISPPESLDKDYLYSLLSSPYVFARFKAAAAGAVVMNLNSEKVRELFIPLPPLAEQHRIATKVDELMALCDQLETRHNNAAEAHEKLVSHLLGALTSTTVRPELVEGQSAKNTAQASIIRQAHDSVRTESFAENWQRIAAHFDTLFTTEASIDALKQTLLQLAVMGKLVPQDPNDEPASELLKRIQAEKTKLIAEGKIKKDKPLPAIAVDEKPFELPKEWEWVMLGTITEIKGGKRVPNGYHLLTEPTPYIYIRVSDMKDGSIDCTDLRYIDSEIREKISRYIITKDDIYMTIVGATIGKCGIIPEKFDQMNLTENAARISPWEGVEKLFLYMCLNGSLCQNQFFDKTKQVGVQKMALNRLASTLIPFPPLAEQHRIVAKVEELMALCDQLKARLAAANQLQQKLADGMVERAIMP
ncbi:restriction endonuclease subunit S [Methylomonas sp. TEB]|uniref:restriction endonuclease subunit S n=1 Tax=Methylomonas sp. TEB TaxID=3398229 RepID=UPI0039F4EEE2